MGDRSSETSFAARPFVDGTIENCPVALDACPRSHFALTRRIVLEMVCSKQKSRPYRCVRTDASVARCPPETKHNRQGVYWKITRIRLA